MCVWGGGAAGRAVNCRAGERRAERAAQRARKVRFQAVPAIAPAAALAVTHPATATASRGVGRALARVAGMGKLRQGEEAEENGHQSAGEHGAGVGRGWEEGGETGCG